MRPDRRSFLLDSERKDRSGRSTTGAAAGWLRSPWHRRDRNGSPISPEHSWLGPRPCRQLGHPVRNPRRMTYGAPDRPPHIVLEVEIHIITTHGSFTMLLRPSGHCVRTTGDIRDLGLAESASPGRSDPASPLCTPRQLRAGVRLTLAIHLCRKRMRESVAVTRTLRTSGPPESPIRLPHHARCLRQNEPRPFDPLGRILLDRGDLKPDEHDLLEVLEAKNREATLYDLMSSHPIQCSRARGPR